MLKRLGRTSVVAVAALALLVTAQPALAFKQTGRTGTIGYYNVNDTISDEGGECWYYQGPGEFEHLAKMWVLLPDVKGIPGLGSEKVGWQYTIQRKIQGQGWTNRLTSKIFTAFTDSSHFAQFSNRSAKVIVPFSPDGPSASYRASLKIFWYGSDGRVIGTVSGRIENYQPFGQITDPDEYYHGSCPDYELQQH